MKKIISVFLCIVYLFACLFGLSACIFNRENPYPYKGEYKELYTAAIYSIPNAEGYMAHGEGAYDSDIYVWEHDSYGRTLFSYCEDVGDQIFGLVVCQVYDETNVYFYPDINYKLTLIDSKQKYEGTKEEYLKNKTEAFYLESKEKLKEENDWDKPIDKTKCVSYLITDHKALGEKTYSLNSIECNEILNEYTETLNLPNPYKYPHRTNEVLQVDAEGKVLHQIYGLHQHYDNPNWTNEDENTCYYILLWVITDKNGIYDKENGVMVMYSKDELFSSSNLCYDAKNILKFKRQNNWVNLYCDE